MLNKPQCFFTSASVAAYINIVSAYTCFFVLYILLTVLAYCEPSISMWHNFQPTQAQWRKVFYIAGGVYIFCATFYNVFGSGRRQEWDNPAEDDALAKKAAAKKADKLQKKANKNTNEAETAQ